MNTYKDYPEKPKDGFGFIYFIRSPAGKGYVGQTVRSVLQRMRCHVCSKGCRYLYSAIQKYGLDFLFVETLGQYPVAELDAEEIKAIAEFGTLEPYGYNLTAGGNANRKCSDATRAKMSEANRNRPPPSDETRRRMSESSKNPSAETRKKISDSGKGKTRSEETRQRMSIAAKNRSAEHLRKIAEANRNRKPTKETLQKLSDSHKGKIQSEETRRKRSASIKAFLLAKQLREQGGQTQ